MVNAVQVPREKDYHEWHILVKREQYRGNYLQIRIRNARNVWSMEYGVPCEGLSIKSTSVVNAGPTQAGLPADDLGVQSQLDVQRGSQ